METEHCHTATMVLRDHVCNPGISQGLIGLARKRRSWTRSDIYESGRVPVGAHGLTCADGVSNVDAWCRMKTTSGSFC